MNRGRVTIPTDADFVEETKAIIKEWGADAVRDCDGTTLPENAADIAEKVYNTYFVIRGDNNWANTHASDAQYVFLLSKIRTATKDNLIITLKDGYFAEQLEADFSTEKYWEVVDRTSGEVISDFSTNAKIGAVIINKPKYMHEYSVSFMAKTLWDPVQIYNYKTNGWDVEKHKMYNPIYPQTAEYIKEHLKRWCEQNKQTNVVRFTTFIYQFSLLFNEKGDFKYVDWFGYTMTVSPKMLDAFEREYGYKMRAEYIVDKGYYNNPFRIPTKEYLDYIDFIERYVTKTVRELVDITHSYAKEAMMFLGDSWIGAEPYGKYFADMNLDAVVGSVGSGTTTRMLADIPHVKYREGRYLPYFFPDTFYDGNDPCVELNNNWLCSRRALMRKPIDRIGYGGYLKLACKFPKFVNRVSEICNEFRALYDVVSECAPYNVLTVAIVNCWGNKRRWMTHMVTHEIFYQQTYSYQGVLEALSGLAVDVRFISFDDVKNGGLQGVDVVINMGDEGTSYSGGSNWADEKILTLISAFVAEGGGFIGIGDPTAYGDNGGSFRLKNILGVDKEKQFTLGNYKYNITPQKHFITADVVGKIDFGESKKNIYALEDATVLDIDISNRCKRDNNVGEVRLAVNSYFKGKSVYISGLPYNENNSRLLYRAMLYAAGLERFAEKCFSTNCLTECNYYPQKSLYGIINNSVLPQSTDFYDIDGAKESLNLNPMEIRWISK